MTDEFTFNRHSMKNIFEVQNDKVLFCSWQEMKEGEGGIPEIFFWRWRDIFGDFPKIDNCDQKKLEKVMKAG